MFKQIGDTVCGVLNDFDLAVQLNNEPHSTSKQRTGTKPYMAIDLLVPQPPYHLYRHDLESFLYVLVFLTCKIEGSPLANWKNLAMENLSNLKHVAITKSGFPRPKDGFEQFELWIIDLRRLFSAGFFNSDEHLSTVRVAQLKRTALPTFDVKPSGVWWTSISLKLFWKHPLSHRDISCVEYVAFNKDGFFLYFFCH
jgi:hypothetical protein